MTNTDAHSHDAVDPDRIFQLAQGFMASKHLFAASELGLFEALGEGPVDLAGLAARTGLTARTARISADAMVALGLLERQGDRYANTPVAATFLSGATSADMRPLLKFWGTGSAIRSGPTSPERSAVAGPPAKCSTLTRNSCPSCRPASKPPPQPPAERCPLRPGCRRRAGSWTLVVAPAPG